MKLALLPLLLGLSGCGSESTPGASPTASSNPTDGSSIHARPGEKHLLLVENQTPYDHPFHLHGFFFEELDETESPVRPLARKDTINVPPLATRRLLVQYDERPGMWMFHCHILDHAQAGMMGMIHVMP